MIYFSWKNSYVELYIYFLLQCEPRCDSDDDDDDDDSNIKDDDDYAYAAAAHDDGHNNNAYCWSWC